MILPVSAGGCPRIGTGTGYSEVPAMLPIANGVAVHHSACSSAYRAGFNRVIVLPVPMFTPPALMSESTALLLPTPTFASQ